jgi:uncharacterized membrane protein
MQRISITIVLLLIISLMSNCEHDPIIDDVPESAKGPSIPQDNTIACDTNVVYFQNDIFPIIKSNCAFSGCHGDGSTQGGVDLSTFNGISNEVVANNAVNSDIYEVITETDLTKRMPKPPRLPLSQEEINLIRDWINQGAIDNRCDDCDTSKYTFSITIKPIIEKNCEGCHSGPNPSGAISLTSYQEINTRAISGQLYGSVSHQPAYSNMPKNQAQLAQCKIDQIKKWVDAGAPNN